MWVGRPKAGHNIGLSYVPDHCMFKWFSIRFQRETIKPFEHPPSSKIYSGYVYDYNLKSHMYARTTVLMESNSSSSDHHRKLWIGGGELWKTCTYLCCSLMTLVPFEFFK